MSPQPYRRPCRTVKRHRVDRPTSRRSRSTTRAATPTVKRHRVDRPTTSGHRHRVAVAHPEAPPPPSAVGPPPSSPAARPRDPPSRSAPPPGIPIVRRSRPPREHRRPADPPTAVQPRGRSPAGRRSAQRGPSPCCPRHHRRSSPARPHDRLPNDPSGSVLPSTRGLVAPTAPTAPRRDATPRAPPPPSDPLLHPFQPVFSRSSFGSARRLQRRASPPSCPPTRPHPHYPPLPAHPVGAHRCAPNPADHGDRDRRLAHPLDIRTSVLIPYPQAARPDRSACLGRHSIRPGAARRHPSPRGRGASVPGPHPHTPVRSAPAGPLRSASGP